MIPESVYDKIWTAIRSDEQLESARRKLSIHEIRLIIAHALEPIKPLLGQPRVLPAKPAGATDG